MQAKSQKETISNKVIATDLITYQKLGRMDKGVLLIEHDINLKGRVCKLPPNMTLGSKGGVLRNGTIVGNNTKIQNNNALFDNITIKGTWNVPQISTRLFVNLKRENALKNVFALTNPKYPNMVIIEEGDYYVKANKGADVCLSVSSNTDLTLNGTIHLVANAYKHYYILNIKGKNIKVRGKGSIIGDRKSHTGNEGEWGMGINLKGAVNATISGLTIKDCWGDCIYVGGNSKNVIIENYTLDGGRRQGISITKANGVIIRNCTITNVGGTAPEYAIDIEPNSKDSVDNILIDNVKVRDCEGGFLVVHGAPKNGSKTPWIGNVAIRNCDVKCKQKFPVRVKRCEKIEIKECKLYAPDGVSAISVTYSGDAIVHNNDVSYYYNIVDKATNGLRDLVGKGKKLPIDIRKTNKQSVKNNRSVARERDKI